MEPEKKEQPQTSETSAATKKTETSEQATIKTDDNKDEKTVPYSRFKEINDKLRAIEVEREAEKKKREEERIAALPEEQRLKEQLTRAKQLEDEHKKLQEKLDEMSKKYDKIAQVELESLEKEDRALVKSIAGDDSAHVIEVIASLKKAGKLGKPSIDRTRTATGDSPEKAKDWKDATKLFNKALSSRK